VRDLSRANVGIGEQRLDGLDVVVREFRRSAFGAADAPRGGKPRLRAFPGQAALEFRQRAKHVKNKPTLRSRRVEGSVRLRKPMPFSRSSSMVSINCFIERAKRSSFHTISVSPLRANSSASRRAGRSVTAPDNCSVKILRHPASASVSRCKARFWSSVINAEASYRPHRPQSVRRGGPMIERYSDHAANERTFLAWVRTAIAVMAFGFLVQKFDLFLRIAAGSLNALSPSAGNQIVGNIAGLLLIVLGSAMMAFAAIRFRKTTRDIDAKEVRPGPGERLDITLVSLLLLLGAILFVYLAYTGISRL
jgi:putative membrane protein